MGEVFAEQPGLLTHHQHSNAGLSKQENAPEDETRHADEAGSDRNQLQGSCKGGMATLQKRSAQQ